MTGFVDQPSNLGPPGRHPVDSDPRGNAMPATEGLTREFDTPDPVRLHVEAGSGAIRVDAAETDRTVVRLRPARDGDEAALDLITRTTVEQRGDQVLVEVPRRGIGFLRSSPELDITVSVPAGSRLESTTDSADVRTTGRLEAVRSKAGSGDVVLDHVGEAHVQAGSGDTELERVDGAMRVQAGSGDVTARTVTGTCWVGTGSGDVRLHQLDGGAQINTASGDVSVDDVTGDVSISTASGDHHLTKVRRGNVKSNSASGDIHVGVVDGTPVWLDVASLSGSVHSALEGSGPPADGEDSVSLRVNTVSGDISLSRA